MIRKYLLVTLILTVVLRTFGQENKAITLLNSNEFKNAISKDNIQLIDVRTPKEYNKGHIKNSININFLSYTFNLCLILF